MNKARILELEGLIQKYKDMYYNNGNSPVSDVEYDALEDELKRLSPNHSLLQKVGSIKKTPRGKVEHSSPMLSLKKTYDQIELATWIGNDPGGVVGLLKIDGNSISLLYKDGNLVLAKTRGNGQFGEDVTAKILNVPRIPKKIPLTSDVEIRGEIFCSHGEFTKLSQEMISLGLPPPTSPRNIVTGILARNSHIELMRYFNLFAFDIIQKELKFVTEMDKMKLLESFDFTTPSPRLIKTKDELSMFLSHVQEKMEEADVGIDGAVFSYNDLSLHESLGNTSHHPKAKLAFKWKGQTGTSTVENVLWATSRLGIVTPVAVIAPINLSGAVITNVTLHNEAHVRSYNLKKGDEIEIVRSGEVIPKFLRVVSPSHGSVVIPQNCPSCQSQLKSDGIRLHCLNKAGCGAQKIGFLLNWLKAVEVDDLSEKRLALIIEKGLVATPADFYRLTKSDLLSVPGIKDKMANKLISNIEKTKSLPLTRFLLGLGVECAGLSTWEKLTSVFTSLEDITHASVIQIMNIDGFADKTARQIVDGLREKEAVIKDLLSVGIIPHHHISISDGSLKGMKFVITGTLTVGRDEFTSMVKRAGGSISGSVSKDTTAVITADPNGNSSKLKKAKSLGVEIWDEQKIRSMI